MAGRRENLKALFTNTRSRVIIIFTGVVLVIAVIIGAIRFTASTAPVVTKARIAEAPGGIASIPGSADPTAEYAALVETRNIQQAEEAAKTGGSAIPTIIRTQAFGKGVQAIGPQQGKGAVGFTTLALEDVAGTQKSLWLQTLKEENCSKAAVEKVVSQGAALTDLKTECSCAQLKDNGYGLSELQQVCSCKELKAAGFNARQLKNIGYTARRLRLCGFNACELHAAGFTAQEMKDGGFTDGELKGAGYSPEEIARAGGLPEGITEQDVRNAGCDAASLRRLRTAGVSAAAIRRINGCSPAQLKAAGFTAEELRNAGFSAADLKNAGFTPAELRAGGFSGRDLLNAGYSPEELAQAGFTSDEIKAAEANLPPGVTLQKVKEAGCDPETLRRERLAGVSAKIIRQQAGCSASALKAAGFTDNDLANAGFSPAEIRAADRVGDDAIRSAGCDPQRLGALLQQGVSAKRIRDLNGCDAATLKAAGFDAKSLAEAGFTPDELRNAGFTEREIQDAQAVSDEGVRAAGCDPQKLNSLRQQGVTAKRIRELNGCDAAALKAAGFDAKSLAEAGFTPNQLRNAGFTPQEVQNAFPMSEADIKAAGCDPAKLRTLYQQGVSAKRIRDLNGCDAAALKAAGFDAKSLADAGFTPQELLAAGFTPQQLNQAGLNPEGVIAAGRTADCSVESLRAARAMGVSAETIKETLGCSAEALKQAGYTAAELRRAGFTAAELRDAGFTPEQLKQAGFSAQELRAAGFSAQELKNTGFTAAQLKEAGFSASELKNAGFTVSELKAAGFSAKELKDAGFSASALRNAGFSAKELKDAGFNANQLKNAGYSDEELKNAGFAPDETVVAGLPERPPAAPRPSAVAVPPGFAGPGAAPAAQPADNAAQLQEILERQQKQMAAQEHQQELQQRISVMQAAASESLQEWKTVSTQVYVEGSAKEEAEAGAAGPQLVGGKLYQPGGSGGAAGDGGGAAQEAIIKTGDVLFAVLDTSVNSDEPGPILATIVSGKLKGSKLIGSFTLPPNADKMVISFNTMSVPGAAKTTSINAYAIDPNTARTALSSRTNHHYLMRYGSLFASTFLQGFGNAFQSAGTTITIGGTGGVQTTTVQSGIGRSILENAVIGLATLGKSWAQVAQQQFNRPTTVEVCSGTGMGILFTQDVTSL